MYDLIVLGGGPAGYEVAYLAATNGLQVALIEKNVLGGVCLNCGCIPLKNFLHVSRIRNDVDQLVKRGELILDGILDIQQKGVVQYKNSIVSVLQQGVHSLLKSVGVEYIQDYGVLKASDNVITVQLRHGEMQARKLVIATGSEAIRLPINHETSNYRILDSKQALDLEEIPCTLLIVGAGVTGLELADYYASAGSRVIIVEASDHIGGNMDLDASDTLKKKLEAKKVEFLLNTTVEAYNENQVVCRHNDEILALNVAYVVETIGRKPNVNQLNLDAVRVKYDAHGIMINDQCQTSNPLIYACGDVTGKKMLAHVAYRQAAIIANVLVGHEDEISDYAMIPSVIYTDPEVAFVGKSVIECKKEGIPFIEEKVPMTYNGRYFSEHGKDGTWAKLIVHGATKEILGGVLMGNNVSEIITVLEIFVTEKMTVDSVKRLIYPHPTMSEIIYEIVKRVN